jgi:hypothetical protein
MLIARDQSAIGHHRRLSFHARRGSTHLLHARRRPTSDTTLECGHLFGGRLLAHGRIDTSDTA